MISTAERLFRQSRNLLDDSHPVVEQAVSTAVRYYATSWVRGGAILGSIRYDAPIEPEQLYEIGPKTIERTLSWTRISADRKSDEHPRFQQPKYRLAGRVFEGDWDTTSKRFTESTIYQSFLEHFQEGVTWKRTNFYNETLAAIDDGATPWGCKSQMDLDKRCDQLDELYDQLAQHGYRTQNELHELGDPTTSPHRIYRVIWSEIAVHIGREGEFIFQDGRNRLAIARLLDLDSISVVVLVRHSNWQQKRDRIARGELKRSDLPRRLRNHPDLVKLF